MQDIKKSLLVMLFIVILESFMITVMGGQQPPAGPPPQAAQVQLTPLGKLAFKSVAQEIQQVQADINALQEAEIKAQNLKAGEWQLNIYTGTLVHVPAPPAPPATPKPAEKPKK